MTVWLSWQMILSPLPHPARLSLQPSPCRISLQASLCRLRQIFWRFSWRRAVLPFSRVKLFFWLQDGGFGWQAAAATA
jgi:hypothetical protein